jgi:PAS domain-containing protein
MSRKESARSFLFAVAHHSLVDRNGCQEEAVEVGQRKDGSLIWVRNSVSLALVTESVPGFIVALSEDIMERKKAEEALRKSEERVRLILDSAAEGIFGCDPEGTRLFCNPSAVRLLGYDDPAVAREKHARAGTSQAAGREAISWPHFSRLTEWWMGRGVPQRFWISIPIPFGTG